MAKNLKSVKSLFIIGLLLISLIISIAPTTSAGRLLNLSQYANVSWSSNATEKPIVPRGVMRSIDLDIIYRCNTGAAPSQIVFALYQGRQVNIKLEIVATPEWTTANLNSGTITTSISLTEQSLKAILSIRVDTDAPAFGAGYVRIKISIPKVGPIDSFEQEFTLEFSPEYLPLISDQLPDGNSKQIGPLDTAVFPIEIENLGNARTRVFLEVVDHPKDWIVVVTDDITLDEAQGSKGTAYLTVKPPKSFGYHYEEESIRVSMLPTRAEDITNQGEKTYVTVVVESRGFSTPGFEIISSIGAIIALMIILKLRKKK